MQKYLVQNQGWCMDGKSIGNILKNTAKKAVLVLKESRKFAYLLDIHMVWLSSGYANE